MVYNEITLPPVLIMHGMYSIYRALAESLEDNKQDFSGLPVALKAEPTFKHYKQLAKTAL